MSSLTCRVEGPDLLGDPVPVLEVLLEGRLPPVRPRHPRLPRHHAVADPAADAVVPRPHRRPQLRRQHLRIRLGELGDRVDPERRELLRRLVADAPQRGRRPVAHHLEPVVRGQHIAPPRLPELRRDLRPQLVVADPHRAVQPRLLQHPRPDVPPKRHRVRGPTRGPLPQGGFGALLLHGWEAPLPRLLHRCCFLGVELVRGAGPGPATAELAGATRRVLVAGSGAGGQERLVPAQDVDDDLAAAPLERAERAHHRGRGLVVRLPVDRQEHRVRALAGRDPQRHAGADAVLPRFVRRGRHHAALGRVAVAADDHRQAGELGPAQHLDRGDELVEVHVQDPVFDRVHVVGTRRDALTHRRPSPGPGSGWTPTEAAAAAPPSTRSGSCR